MNTMFEVYALVSIGAPILLLAGLGLPPLLGFRVSESFAALSARAMILIGLGGLLCIAVPLGLGRPWSVSSLQVSEIILLSESHFHLRLEFVFDDLSVPMAVLTYVLCGIVAAFATNYMHREVGFQRFFFLFAMFLVGMNVAVLAGSIETLFLGWELVGLSSALLVAFFHERPGPVGNGLRIWTVYRFSDAALLVAAVLLHHTTSEGEFTVLSGRSGWPHSAAVLDESRAMWVGALLVFAAIGKSALWPLSGWLPRAMEGPTPSSAVFYGALSIHLGAYLLLRVGPILDQSPALSLVVVAVGLLTAFFAVLAGRTQTDIKSGLACASLVQVGLIVAEIGLGFRYLALLHITGHASLRTLQLLRAPSLLRDYHDLGNALGKRVTNRLPVENVRPNSWVAAWLYRLGLERGYLDVTLDLLLVRPFHGVFLWCDKVERRWLKLLAGPQDSSEGEFSDLLLEERK